MHLCTLHALIVWWLDNEALNSGKPVHLFVKKMCEGCGCVLEDATSIVPNVGLKPATIIAEGALEWTKGTNEPGTERDVGMVLT